LVQEEFFNMLSQYPQRQSLHNEVHARPPEAMTAPVAITHIVMLVDAAQRNASRAHLATLLSDRHLPSPDAASTHVRMDLGSYRIRWELHTEFVTWTFIRPVDIALLDEQPELTASQAVPQAWLAELPGQCLTSVHLWVRPISKTDSQALVPRLLLEETLVASTVADGCGEIYTDFIIHPDGFSRMLLLVGAMAPRRLGRLVQQLLEIETYRMAALMGLPAAREASNVLASAERELAELAMAIRSASRDEEPQLLNRLTRLAGQVESQYATSHSRFSASSAYFELVDMRIKDIAEFRLGGLQTIREFMDRRLNPARTTCQWAVRRQDGLSQRVSRISNLLRTRVEIEQQQGNQAVLEAMNQRQGLQLKMQSTVEGLSVAAITYYIVGLIGYLVHGAKVLGWPLSFEVTTALTIPLVALGVWWSIRRIHRRLVEMPA
jgi:uncharacterized membrane-anchored protein